MKKAGLVLLGIAGLTYEAFANFFEQAHEVGAGIADTMKKSKTAEEAKNSKGS